MVELIILLLIGIGAGVLAGLLGIGGGIIFTPVLFFLFEGAGVENPVIWTIASGLFCTFVAASGSLVRQHMQDNVFWSEGIKLGIMGAIGVFAGKMVLTSPYYSREEFVIFFSMMLLYAAYMMFGRGKDQGDEYERAFEPLRLKQSFVTGGIGGFVAALAGVGGGGVMVPIMNLFYKQPFRKAVSISHLAMVIMGLSGWGQLALEPGAISGITEYSLGYVDFGAALPLSLGGLAGGFGGALLNHKIKRKWLQWGFAILAVAMAGRLIWGIL
ncbi:sulfite exporter TauE/SafE family protein [Gracilimonas tropica]|uniref:sulfite exporter TauE/SafE family protein n=1 Tax=Gracilimonas tropica TaxID=454600 RepID=UPI0003607EA9|nr:sulfite exporter TauE/SafE family protein [Gracilimonas tropica]